jgi:hypothetical protein
MSKLLPNYKTILKPAKETLKIGRTNSETPRQRPNKLRTISILTAKKKKKLAISPVQKLKSVNSIKIDI